MATKIVHTREKPKKASIDELRTHLTYLKDTTHPDHKGLILHPAKTYNCGPTAEDFVAAVEASQTKYLEVRDGLQGKRTADIWEEAINNMDEGCYHTPAEREAIEKEMISKICPGSPALTTWHENLITGECDLHIIFPTKNPVGELTLKRTETHLLKRMKMLDKFAADVLNKSKKKPAKRKKHIPTAEEVAKKKSKAHAKKAKKPVPCPLELQIARLAEEDGIDEVQPRHLRDLLKRLGIIIERYVGRTIHVIYSRTKLVKKADKNDPNSKEIRAPRTGVICLDDLLDKVFRMQIQIRREKSREISAEITAKKNSPQQKDMPKSKGKNQEDNYPNNPE
ncbi:MAG: hypothetical protein EAZ82_12260 [Verrucomicrobia bacterium]|nr:MAG: hypothetical protein EAZ82_12260 [Verrucomicrobiota bacterium]